MLLPFDCNPDFEKLWTRLKNKYPQELFEVDGTSDNQVDAGKFTKKFFFNKSTTADVSVDPNSNVEDNNTIVYNTERDKAQKRLESYARLWEKLSVLYGKEEADTIIEMQVRGDIYINDAHGIVSGQPYCFNYSAYDIQTKGLPMVHKIECVPPKYFTSFKSQLEQFTIIASNSTLGATGLADLYIVMSYYVKNMLNTLMDEHFHFASKEDVWAYVKANIISTMYTFNQPMRANQSPFTNVSVYDKYFLENMCSDYIFPDGSTPDIKIVQEIQKIFVRSMNEELRRTLLTFPVTTACFSVDSNREVKDREFLRFIAEENLEFAFMNIYGGKSSTLSSCCRLRSDRDNEYFNSFGSGSSKIGSEGVCTIDFPRLSYKHREDQDTEYKDFFKELKYLVGVCAKVNNAKREIIRDTIACGKEPLYEYGFMDLARQYSTCGVNGLNECVAIAGFDIVEDAGTSFALDIMKTINEENDYYEKLYKVPHNCEQVPGETLSVKLADKDKILGYDTGYDIYSNQFIPLTCKADLLDRIRLQGIFDKHFSGGAICHLNIEQRIDKVEDMENLITSAIKQGVIYFAVNYNLQRCSNKHMTVGKDKYCKICGAPIEDVFTRVVGFFTNTKSWLKKRREKDYPHRVFY